MRSTAILLAGIPLIASQVTMECKRFPQIYANGTELCEKMWGDSFVVSTNYSAAYTMWFFTEDNPNDQISANLHPTGNTSVCWLDSLHKDHPTPEGDNFTDCTPWKNGACCNSDIANAAALDTLYGPE